MRPQVISFKCILKTKAGRFISSTYNREVLTAGPQSGSENLPGLAKNLADLRNGEKRSFTLHAAEAYGLYDPGKVILFPRKKLPTSTKKGDELKILSKTNTLRVYRVLELHGDFASLDGNHPLAGEDLVFEIETLEARYATAEDLQAAVANPPGPIWH